jgi:dCMP deaminase
MKPKMIDAHMTAAEVYAKQSSAKRLNVGCVIVKNDTIIGIGYNGMPSGWTNECEDKHYVGDAGGWLCLEEILEQWPLEDDEGRYRLATKPEVLHAESNALMKVARSTNSSEGATLFVTHAPCVDCSKLIHQAGIKEVYYKNDYRDFKGINFLEKCGINVEKIT